MRRLAFALLLVLAGCGGPSDVESLGWLAMGTTAQLSFKTAEGPCAANESLAFGKVKETFEEVERKLSIWRPDSEISRYVSLDQVSPETRPCYEAAFALMRETEGAFNPRWRGPKTLDLGAIAKGFAVDIAAGMPSQDTDMLIDLGGNVKALRGDWRTGVKDPNGGGFAAVVDLHEGEALATSATYYRGSHIYDGRTGLAVSNGVASVTVLCRSAMWADGLSTTLFILGPEAGRAFVEEKCPLFMPDCDALPDGKYAAVLWILSDGRQVKLDPDSRFSAR